MNRMAPLALVAALIAFQGALAQPFPGRQIRLVTQFQAGSGGDANLRAVAEPFGQFIGQPVVIENRPGAGGVVAAEYVARSAPDGYTILGASSATQVIRMWISKTMPFDPVKDFTPITQLSDSLAVVVAHPSVPAANFHELVEYARRNPGRISYGSSGVGSEHQLSGEQIRQLTGIDIVHVPYKATAQALLDVVSGQLPISFSLYSAAMPFIASGKVKMLAIVRSRRAAQLPELQTIGEAVPGFEEPPTWSGLLGPAGLPEPVLRRLSTEAIRAVNHPSVKAKYAAAGSEAVGSTPEVFAAQIRRQIELVGRIVKAAGIQPE
jgi:tripartite-type tricarboxylate transporter receptor subunit TctC